MMTMFRALFLACGLSLLLAACQTPPTPAPDAGSEAATTAATASERLATLFEEADEEYLRMNPLAATFRGDHRYNDRWVNSLSDEYETWQRAYAENNLATLRSIDRDQLTDQERLSYEIFELQNERTLEGMQYPSDLIPLNQFYNPLNFVAQLGSGQSAQPFRTVQHYDDWIARLNGIFTADESLIEHMREGMARDIVQPDVLMEAVLPQLEAHVVSDPTQSLFYMPIRNMPDSFSAADRERLDKLYQDTISSLVVPGYQQLHDFVKNEYLPETRTTDGMGALPGGDEWYRFRVKSITSTDLTPEQIHQIGLDEVARIHSEMRGVMDEVGFEGSLDEFFEFTKNDAQFIFESREDMMQAYEDLRARVAPGADRLFSMQPKAEFEIRPVEAFREKSASAASYQSPAQDGSRPGIFYVNTYDLSARPVWTVEPLYLHEAIPGHHFQRALQQEVEGLPQFRRSGGNTAYTEGWGLYAESLGKEIGIYTDPYQYYGSLTAELWRAIRLVVDTGLHAKGWSREEVLDYMYANAPVAEARAVSEAERFMAIPGQATAYKIGQLKIQELRDYAESELGDRFDIQTFHAEVLKDGAVPLNILERKIKRWVAEQKLT